MREYYKPFVNSYSAEKLQEVIGPAQAQYVELQINYEQIQKPITKLDKIEKVIRVTEKETPTVYKINNVA